MMRVYMSWNQIIPMRLSEGGQALVMEMEPFHFLSIISMIPSEPIRLPPRTP
jgi:hypothetical protein